MTTNRFHTEEEATGFVQWADQLVAERDLARAEAASWEERCLDARREVAELRAAAAQTRGARATRRLVAGRRLSLAERDAIHAERNDGRGTQ